MGFTLDTGAFIALQRRKRRAWHFIELASIEGVELRWKESQLFCACV